MTKTPKNGDRLKVNPKFVENQDIKGFQRTVLSRLDPEKVYTIKEVQSSFSHAQDMSLGYGLILNECTDYRYASVAFMPASAKRR